MIKVVAKNKKAFYDYEILEKLEAGISLKGTEIKSIRMGKINLKNSFVEIINDEVFLRDCHISDYEMGSYNNHNPLRIRKLLLHKREIIILNQKVKEKGLTIVPLSAYFSSNKIKIEIALVKGKKLWDKRESLANKSAKRNIERTIKQYNN